MRPSGGRDHRECAMGAFAGERSKREGYEHQKLPGGDRTAAGDARATPRPIERMGEGGLRTTPNRARPDRPTLYGS